LAAGAEDIASTAPTDKHIEAILSHDGLKGQNVTFRWAAEGTSGKFIEGDQIDFTSDPSDELGEPAGIVRLIVHPGQ
jgi:hypothetical protein